MNPWACLLTRSAGGVLARWPMANVFTGCMIGAHSNELILDGFIKNVTGVDYEVSHLMCRSTDNL